MTEGYNDQDNDEDRIASLEKSEREALQAENDKLRAERERLFDADEPMAEDYTQVSAAENALTWLIVEPIGVPDDRAYSPNEAMAIIADALERGFKSEAEVARLTAALAAEESRSGRMAEALKAIRGEAARARGDQSYRDLARFVLKATLAALKEKTDDAQA